METDSAPDPATGDQNTQLYMRFLMSWMVELKEDRDYANMKRIFKEVCEAAWDQRQGNSCLAASDRPHMTVPTVKYLLYELLRLREDGLFELLVNRLEHRLQERFVHRLLTWLEEEERRKPRAKAIPRYQATHFRAV